MQFNGHNQIAAMGGAAASDLSELIGVGNLRNGSVPQAALVMSYSVMYSLHH